MFRKISTIAALGAFVALAAGCSTPPADLDLALDTMSSHGAYRVALVPPAQAPAINELHSWQIKLTTPAGAPKP